MPTPKRVAEPDPQPSAQHKSSHSRILGTAEKVYQGMKRARIFRRCVSCNVTPEDGSANGSANGSADGSASGCGKRSLMASGRAVWDAPQLVVLRTTHAAAQKAPALWLSEMNADVNVIANAKANAASSTPPRVAHLSICRFSFSAAIRHLDPRREPGRAKRRAALLVRWIVQDKEVDRGRHLKRNSASWGVQQWCGDSGRRSTVDSRCRRKSPSDGSTGRPR